MFKASWMFFTMLIQKQQNLLCEMTKSWTLLSMIDQKIVIEFVTTHFYIDFNNFLSLSFVSLSFRVVYSQNLRRMKSWIVSKTFSEIVVKSYWTMSNNVKCHAMKWINANCQKNSNIYEFVNKILNCLLMTRETICKIRSKYLLFKKYSTCIFRWMQYTNQTSYMR